MPTISKFYGIIVRMFYKDHAPPHFHAIYGEYELLMGISPILEGEAPNRVRSMILEWSALHRTARQLRTLSKRSNTITH
ncbi:MAG: DUF4160 domain-containing protein [Candidatus Parabeggiatoa sp. nov. 1]|nr:MAG: DUF4160 domain-containing protein [Gammaproteobacteria bacterium]